MEHLNITTFYFKPGSAHVCLLHIIVTVQGKNAFYALVRFPVEERVSLSFVYTVCTFSSLLQFGQVTLCMA